jgi:hypothetical protein
MASSQGIYGALEENTPDLENGSPYEVPVATRVPSSRENKSKHALFKSTSHFWTSEAEYYQGDHSKDLRMDFISKVYTILSFQLLLTVIVGSVCIEVAPVRNFMVDYSTWFVLFSFIPTICTIFALMFYKDVYPTNYVLLVTFTVRETSLQICHV